MSGPWEKYQQQGPWTKYAQPAPAAPEPEAAPAEQPGIMDRIGQFGAGMLKGAAPLAGLPMDMISAWGAGSLGQKGPDLPMGSAWMEQPAENVPAPADATDRRLRAAGEYIGPSVPFGLGAVASGAASGLAAGQVREMGGGKATEMIAALLAGGVPLMAANKISKVAQTKRAIDAVPDIEDLQSQAQALYQQGRATGTTAPGSLTQGLEAKTSKIATDAGLIAPDGTLAPDYAKLSHALKMAKSYAGGDMNPEQMQQVRRAFQAAAQSADANEARIGTQMLREFDQGIRNPLVPEFQQADQLYSRSMRGEEIKQAIDIARKGRRTASDTAISNEFQGLVRKGIRGDLTYPPELVAAVEKAANPQGGRAVASAFGKAAPSGVVSAGLGFGVPAAVTAPILGPGGAMAAGTASSGVGMLARLLANRMAAGDAREALATALNGAPLKQAQMPDEIRRAIAALLASTAGQLPTQ